MVLPQKKNQFAISLEARNRFKDPGYERPRINEVVLGTWPKGTSRALPLEAFIYVFSQGKAIGLEGAKFMQADYFNTVGDIIPVVRVTLVDGAPTAFSYHEAEQSEAWKG